MSVSKINKTIRQSSFKDYQNDLHLFDNFCVYCGIKLTKHEFSNISNDTRNNRSYDHVIPRAKSRKIIVNNKVQCCKRCNRIKSDLSLLVFLFKSKKKILTRNNKNNHIKLCKMAKYKTLEKSVELDF